MTNPRSRYAEVAPTPRQLFDQDTKALLRTDSVIGRRFTSYRVAGCIPYIVQRGETVFSIARRAYGDAGLWWRILDANLTITNPVDELEDGMTILVPPRAFAVSP